MEEFRPLIVDQVVTAAIKRGSLTPGHGRREDSVDGVLLTSAGRKVIIDGYEKRMLTTTRGALPDFSGSLRRHLYRQAERVAAFIHDPTATWTGLSWR
jgi:CRISPR-associated protein Cas1